MTNYPLHIKFKAISLANQAHILDSTGDSLFYIKQKLLKIKERIIVYEDDSQQQPICFIQADRVIDWSAKYHFSDPKENVLGGVQRKGARSLWKAEYEIFNNNGVDFVLREESAFVRFMDGIVGEIPILGIFSGYFFNPIYNIFRSSDGALVMRLVKERSLLETGYRIEKTEEVAPAEEFRLLLGALTAMTLERFRG